MGVRGSAERKVDVKKHYNSTADSFDELFMEEQAAKHNLALENVDIDSDSKVLDVGCGTGEFILKVAEKAQLVLGIDISDKMLGIAKLKVTEMDNSFLICADADNLPVRNGTFDMVFAITLIQNMPHPALTVREILRAATSDGELIISGLKKGLPREYLERILSEEGFQLDMMLGIDKGLKDYVAFCRRRLPV